MSDKKDTNSLPDGYRVLTTSELRELLQDEDKMDQIVRLSEKFQELQVDREMLLATNRSLAEESLACRPRLINGKQQLAAKYQELAKLAPACQGKQSQLETNMQNYNPQSAQQLLQKEVEQAEEQSEDLLEKFMEGSMPLEVFLECFQSSRKIYHIRRAQAEKMQEFNCLDQNLRKHKMAPEEEQKEPRPNGFITQGPPRVFQLRYGLTPAIILPHFPLPSFSAPIHAAPANLPPLDSQPGRPHVLRPGFQLSGRGQPIGLRVIGQIPSWPTRPVRLQQLYRPGQSQQPEPPYR